MKTDSNPLRSNITKKERILLVGVGDTKVERAKIIQSVEELANLATTAGGEVVESLLQVRPRYDPATLIGSGKAGEFAVLCKQLAIELLIFDVELSAAQIRNLERIIGIRVIDRTTLILDIFAKHAHTKEAKLQVELAQLDYRVSRLVGMTPEFSRLGGGIGTRGPGEKKLEVDRRRIKQRISTLRASLERIEHSKQVQRKKRLGIPKITVVGYTNAGKSYLVNSLTKANLITSDHLFSTLDSNTKILFIQPRHKLLISDTVGFLKDLPHGLIASFHATLAEVLEADILIHLVDATAEDIETKILVVENALSEIGADHKPQILVFNKIDRLFEEEKERFRAKFPQALFVSAKEGIGLGELKEQIKSKFF